MLYHSIHSSYAELAYGYTILKALRRRLERVLTDDKVDFFQLPHRLPEDKNSQTRKLLVVLQPVLPLSSRNPHPLLKTRSNLALSPEYMESQPNSGSRRRRFVDYSENNTTELRIHIPSIIMTEVYLFSGVSLAEECRRLQCLLAPSRSPVSSVASNRRNAQRTRHLQQKLLDDGALILGNIFAISQVRTMLAQIMALDEEHDERVELFMSVHKPKEVSGVSLREDLDTGERVRSKLSDVGFGKGATRYSRKHGPSVRISAQVVEDPEAALVQLAQTTMACTDCRLQCH